MKKLFGAAPTEQPYTRLITREDIDAAHARFSNWGRWGAEDQLGTLNHITSAQVRDAVTTVRAGRIISLGLDFNAQGPQSPTKGWGGRFNPIHTMLATGTDAIAGRQEGMGIQYADDAINMPLQCGTQWDALGHVFWRGHTYNGYDAALVDSRGAHVLGIEHTRASMVGRGVLLDIPLLLGADYLQDGFAISNSLLDACAAAQRTQIRTGDFVMVRTGQMERCFNEGDWGGYAGGDAPGLAFETHEWIANNHIAAICTDTWGCEVRPNHAEPGLSQPWHQVVIPAIGITMGEIFKLDELATYCAQYHRWEFLFCAPPLPITGGCGSPINPQAIL